MPSSAAFRAADRSSLAAAVSSAVLARMSWKTARRNDAVETRVLTAVTVNSTSLLMRSRVCRLVEPSATAATPTPTSETTTDRATSDMTFARRPRSANRNRRAADAAGMDELMGDDSSRVGRGSADGVAGRTTHLPRGASTVLGGQAGTVRPRGRPR